MLLFFVVADAVDDAVVDCVVDDYFVVYYPPFHPMGKGVLLCCVVVDCWSLVVDCSKKWTLPTFYCQTLGDMRGKRNKREMLYRKSNFKVSLLALSILSLMAFSVKPYLGSGSSGD